MLRRPHFGCRLKPLWLLAVSLAWAPLMSAQDINSQLMDAARSRPRSSDCSMLTLTPTRETKMVARL